MEDGEIPFACDMTAIAAEQRDGHLIMITELFSLVQKIRELPDGYAFDLPNEPAVLLKVADFISLERLCCPFLGFCLEIKPEGGPVSLSLTGREGVKPFIMAEISGHIRVNNKT